VRNETPRLSRDLLHRHGNFDYFGGPENGCLHGSDEEMRWCCAGERWVFLLYICLLAQLHVLLEVLRLRHVRF
jgi:hypothetical protein